MNTGEPDDFRELSGLLFGAKDRCRSARASISYTIVGAVAEESNRCFVDWRFVQGNPGMGIIGKQRRRSGNLAGAVDPQMIRVSGIRTDILRPMRFYSLLFGLISLVVLVMFFIYVIRGPVDPLIAGGLFVSFLACAVPALILLKPTSEPSAELKRRQEARKERARQRSFTDDPPKDPGS